MQWFEAIAIGSFMIFFGRRVVNGWVNGVDSILYLCCTTC
jgi:hypothetical protein